MGISVPAGAADWSCISKPPSIARVWTCRQGRPENQTRVINEDDGDASSDDEDGVELEPGAEVDDADLIEELDRAIDSGFLD